MIDKRYLYRGFYPDENGNTIITLNGEKKKGEWNYYDLISGETWENIISIETKEIVKWWITHKQFRECIPETIGQWVTTDKNGKDLFEGDRAIKQTILFGTIRGVITYDDKSTRYVMRMKNSDMCDLTDVEYYDNIFEQKENDNE